MIALCINGNNKIYFHKFEVKHIPEETKKSVKLQQISKGHKPMIQDVPMISALDLLILHAKVKVRLTKSDKVWQSNKIVFKQFGVK